MASLTALIRTLRPRQWTKNLAVFGPLLFSRSVLVPGAALHAAGAVVSFCLLAGSVYVLNDWVDRDRDRLHPKKRLRPIPAGELRGLGALLLGLGCAVAGLALAWSLKPVGAAYPAFAYLAVAYLALQVLYSFFLKHLVILDVGIIAVGFVMRVAGGGVAISVPVSHWLYLCTLLLATFLGFAKRRQELSSLASLLSTNGGASAHRAVLDAYSLPLLDQLISVVAGACIVSYGLYSVSPDTLEKVGSDRMKFTVPFAMYGIFRYLFLVHNRGEGGSPERVLLSDWPMILTVLLFTGVASWALYS